MATINENALVKGAKGNVNKQFVYRTRGNKTSIAKMPARSNKPATAKQNDKRDQFTYAALFAQGVVTSKELKKKYEKKVTPGTTAYNIAFRDFMVVPVVKKINTENYNGEVNSIIRITAKDDFRVIAVKLAICNSKGQLVEEGNAILDPLNRKHWIYIAKHHNDLLAGSTIKATAFDIPNNKGILEISV